MPEAGRRSATRRCSRRSTPRGVGSTRCVRTARRRRGLAATGREEIKFRALRAIDHHFDFHAATTRSRYERDRSQDALDGGATKVLCASSSGEPAPSLPAWRPRRATARSSKRLAALRWPKRSCARPPGARAERRCARAVRAAIAAYEAGRIRLVVLSNFVVKPIWGTYLGP